MERMLKFKKNFNKLRIEELSEENVFEFFFFSKRKILFIVDVADVLKGIITLKDYTEHQGDIQKAVNENYRFVRQGPLDRMLDEAERIYHKYMIQSDIPVLDDSEKITGFITDIKIDSDKNTFYFGQVEKAKHKIKEYIRSCYLKKEVTAFCEVMKYTRIYARKCMAYDEIFSLFDNKFKVILLSDKDYINKVKDIMKNENTAVGSASTDLIFDFEMGNREILYKAAGITLIYNLESFISEFSFLTENEEFSRIIRITKSSEYRLKDFIRDNGMSDIKFASNKLLTGYVNEYMNENNIPVVLDQICCTSAMEVSCLVNGIRGSSKDIIGFTYCDLIEQQICLYKELKNKGIPVFHVIGAVNAEMTESEKRRIRGYGRLETLIAERDLQSLHQLYGDDCKERDVLEYAEHICYSYPVRRRFENDIIVNADYSSRYVNFENGIRKTCYQPEQYVNTIYVTGPCFALGSFVEDKHTIPSLLSKRLQEERYPYRVVNLGMLAANDGKELLKQLSFIKGDIVIHLYYTENPNIKGDVIDVSDVINSLSDRDDFFFDKSVHCNRKGNEIYADAIYENIKNVLNKSPHAILKKNRIYDIFHKNSSDFHISGNDAYLKMLEKERVRIPADAESIGSIVMNANPFTFGHRYLIEYASKHSDYLFVFVVEEEKSFFQYEDRISMIKEGCADIENMSVIPSGKMIVSNLTLPEYFQREAVRDNAWEEKEIRLNTSTDLTIFVRYIVPILGITKRFVAEEPLDHLTRQYNEGMKKILTLFDVELREIPRKTLDSGEVISASSVRKMYKNRQFEKMKEMVPPSTYHYLVKYQDKYITTKADGAEN